MMRPASRSSRSSSRQLSRPSSAKRSGSARAGSARSGSRSRSASPTKKRTISTNEPNFLFETGTLGSGLQSMKLGGDSFGTTRESYAPTYSFRGIPPETFVRMVKETFYERPEVYKKFVKILSQVERSDADKLDLVKRVITLFHGYPHLIEGFNTFLPSDYSIEIQEDAVIIKVFDTVGTNPEDVNTGHARSTESLRWNDNDGRMDNFSETTLRYIHQVKEMYADQPHKYRQFTDILRDFHGKRVNEVDTVHRIVALCRQYPHLIVGFNAFLPDGFHVYITEKGYDVEYPGDNEGERTIMQFKK